MILDASQQVAIERAVSGHTTLITGGAGTGKTTIIREIAERLSDATLCAFAGKAAARLKEATGYPTSTIHRMLRYTGAEYLTKTLSGQSIIIDEASMIDSALLAEVVRRNPDRLVLVGDEAQLPPVGRGQPFHDLLEASPDLVQRLTTCYRQTEAVYHAANEIRDGQMPERFAESEREWWEIRATGGPGQTQSAIMALVEAGEVDFSQDIVLIPRNGESDEQACTVKALNAAIREIVNPEHGDRRVDIGDRVINTKNFADHDVWNGTTGTVHAIDDDNQIWVQTDLPVTDMTTGEQTDMVLFDRDMRGSLRLAYALTVHKAQGSQYRRVVFAALSRDTWSLLDRSLIYTAVTRTREQCLVVVQPRALQQGIETRRVKTTVLQELARGAA
jgi:exodeoxyribonuclease V alpha subunit